MASGGEIKVDVKAGPTLRTALDVLDFAEELYDLIPEWQVEKRKELVARAQALTDICTRQLKNANA